MSEAWDDYWSGAEDPAATDAVQGCAPGGGLARFWRSRFDQLVTKSPQRLVDIASGGGAVSREAARVAGARALDLDVVCIDVSAAAAAAAAGAASAAGAQGVAVVGDAAHTPLAEQAFDLVVSQFGVEYAGRAALEQVSRLTAPGGACVVVAHLYGGAIQTECAGNVDVLSALIEQDLCGHGRALFDALAQADAVGGREDMAYRHAVEVCAKAAADNPGPAADYAARLAGDIATLLQRRAAFDPGDAAAWFAGQSAAAAAYLGRMRAMVSAALTRADIDAVCKAWAQYGLEVEIAEPMADEPGRSHCAWRLQASRPPG